MAGLELRLYGVSFASVKEALVSFFFKYDGMSKEELDICRGYVLPMQHNIMQPIKPDEEGQDTWIQYWIDNDDRLTQDVNQNGLNVTQKVARITARFLGTRGESWAKSFHHLNGRQSGYEIWKTYCNAQQMPYVFPIVPVNVDYFSIGNTTLAFNVSILLHYYETLDYRPIPGKDADRLLYVGLAAGIMNDEKQVGLIATVLDKIDTEADGDV